MFLVLARPTLEAMPLFARRLHFVVLLAGPWLDLIEDFLCFFYRVHYSMYVSKYVLCK